jgi:hypothetical protein
MGKRNTNFKRLESELQGELALPQEPSTVDESIDLIDQPPSNQIFNEEDAEIFPSDPISETTQLMREAQTDISAAQNNSGEGMFTIPKQGSKVWTFFHAGETQRPVYFAYSLEPEGWKNSEGVQSNNNNPNRRFSGDASFAHYTKLNSGDASLTFQNLDFNVGTLVDHKEPRTTLENGTGSKYSLFGKNKIEKIQNDSFEYVKGDKETITIGRSFDRTKG